MGPGGGPDEAGQAVAFELTPLIPEAFFEAPILDDEGAHVVYLLSLQLPGPPDRCRLTHRQQDQAKSIVNQSEKMIFI